MSAPGQELERLIDVMARLRGEGGCPWDRAQSLATLRPYLVEEAFEVLDEMDRVSEGGPWRALCEELGDLLFQIVFHAQLGSELGEFTMADVARSISDKLVRRHPHVFGEGRVAGAEQVLANWARLKAEERREKHGHAGSVLDGVPTGAPALLRAERLTEKASRIGFDWPDVAGVREKLSEELAELDAAVRAGDQQEVAHELGDVLFSLANLARFLGVPAEDALRGAIGRFTRRFHHIERRLEEAGVPFGEAPLEVMEAHWQEAKRAEASHGGALPPPGGAPRAALGTLEVAVVDEAAQTRFWDALAPALGWWRRAGSPATYTDGALALVFVPGAAPPERPTLTFEAPGRGAVAALSRALAGWGAEPLPGSDAAGVVFRDPAGLTLRYRVPSPT